MRQQTLLETIGWLSSAAIAFLLCFLLNNLAFAKIHQGYFLAPMENVQHEERYKEPTGEIQTIDVYDYGPPNAIHEPNVIIKPVKIGEKKVPVYEWRVRKWTTKRPKLGMKLRDYQIVGEYGGEKLIYVITSDRSKWLRLNKHLSYLGNSIQQIVRKSLTSSEYLPIARRLLYSQWYTGIKDENGNLIPKRGNMAQWIADGKPKLLDKWWPKVQYAGVPCPMPTNEGVDGKLSEIGRLMGAK